MHGGTVPAGSDFYPRPPRGGRRLFLVCAALHHLISIHALREEGDLAEVQGRTYFRHFYPRPPRGGRPGKLGGAFMGLLDFYPRPPRGGRPSPGSMPNSATIYFYPRPPRGGRPDNKPVVEHNSLNFYPRPPRGGRPDESSPSRTLAKFLSTPSARRATA